MLQLRPYQEDALQSLFDFWSKGGENGLIEMATGTGKSLVQAKLAERLIADYPDMRIISVTHVAELISQNYQELCGIWPFAPAGIYSAGLGQRDSQSQILFCGIQTVHSKARKIGHVDLVMVDEAHLIPRKADTMYGRFLGDLAAINPDMRVCGFTATPYRTDSGRLDEGDVRMFDEIVYTYGIADGIKDGFLAPLVSKGTETGFDLGGVARRGGDYVPGALQAAVDKQEVTRRAVDEIIAMGASRRSWLSFCAGVDHAHHVAEEIRSRGITCATITGDTPSGERARIIEDFKAYKIRCLTNNSVLTTGFNHPGVDLIASLRPTLSCGLYVQMMGRGTRTAQGKDNCLVLDFAGNVRRHGPVDAVEPRKPGKGDGEAPVKECPECHSLVHISKKECPDCGHIFPENEKPKHEATASVAPILKSVSTPEWLPVIGRSFHYHDKVGGTPSVRTHFVTGIGVAHKHWLCPGHQGYPKQKADKFWKDHGGAMPAPRSPEEWINRKNELNRTREIQVRPSGRYYEVIGIKAGDQPANDNIRLGKVSGLDDEIPF